MPRPAHDAGALEDEQVDQFVDKGLQVIYGGKSADGQINEPIANMLRRNNGDPAQSLADTAARVASMIIAGAQESNFSLDPAAAFAGMMQIVGELATVAGDEGIYDYAQDEIDQAAVRAGETLHGLSPDFFGQEEAMLEADDIAQASKTGELDEAIGALQSTGGAPVGGGMMGEGQ